MSFETAFSFPPIFFNLLLSLVYSLYRNRRPFFKSLDCSLFFTHFLPFATSNLNSRPLSECFRVHFALFRATLAKNAHCSSLFFAVPHFRPHSQSPAKRRLGSDLYPFPFLLSFLFVRCPSRMASQSSSSLGSNSASSTPEQQLVLRSSSRGTSTSSRPSEPTPPSEPKQPTLTPSVRPDGSRGNRSDFFQLYHAYIQEDIPSTIGSAHLPHLRKEYMIPDSMNISEPKPFEKADTPRQGWVCFYEITFKIGVRLPLHPFMCMILDHFNLAPSQLMPNSWRYLLGLVVLSLKYGVRIDLPVLLNFFYLKSCEEGRYSLYARTKMRILDDPTSSDKRWKNKFFYVKNEDAFGSESGVRSTWSIPGNP